MNASDEQITQKIVVGIINEPISYSALTKCLMAMNPMLGEDDIS